MLSVRLITCGINLLGPSRQKSIGRGQMYTHVKKYKKVQIWREGLSGLKQDGPKRYVGAGQQLLEHFFPRGSASEQLSVQSNRLQSTNAQTTVGSDYKPMEHQFKKQTERIKLTWR